MQITFMQGLCLIFVVLKLCNVIDWSWWWVTCPIWGLLSVIIVLGFIGRILER